MTAKTRKCGDCLSFDPRMGLPHQYCPLIKQEVAAGDKACSRFFHRKEK